MDAQQVKKIAALARIALTETEVKMLQTQFAEILAHIHQIREVDLQGIEPVSHPFDIKNVFREDEVRPPLGEATLAHAPDAERGMIRVPKIIA